MAAPAGWPAEKVHYITNYLFGKDVPKDLVKSLTPKALSSKPAQTLKSKVRIKPITDPKHPGLSGSRSVSLPLLLCMLLSLALISLSLALSLNKAELQYSSTYTTR